MTIAGSSLAPQTTLASGNCPKLISFYGVYLKSNNTAVCYP